MLVEARPFAKGEMKACREGVRKNRVARQDGKEFVGSERCFSFFCNDSYHFASEVLTFKNLSHAISRSLLSVELEEFERNRVAVRARVLAARGQRFFGGHRSPLSGSASVSSSAASPSVAASDDDDDDNGFVAQVGSESPFRAEGGEDEEDDDMEDGGGDAASVFVPAPAPAPAPVVASSSAPVGSVIGRPVGTGTVVFKRYVDLSEAELRRR